MGTVHRVPDEFLGRRPLYVQAAKYRRQSSLIIRTVPNP